MSENNNTEAAFDRNLLAPLPREDAVPSGEADELVAALRASGHLGRRRRWTVGIQLAAAVALLVAGGAAGARIAMRGSLETALERNDLSTEDRVLLLQRAGSAYVRAAQSYADATAKVDSTAVQVATQVLVGAASAVARHKLDSGLSDRLTMLLASGPGAARNNPNVVWY